MSSQFRRYFEGTPKGIIDKVFGITVTYERPGVGSVSLTAIAEDSTVEAFARDGTVISLDTRDFRMCKADLIINNVATLPERNDLVRVDVDGTTKTYRVLPDTGVPHYRYDDAHEFGLRVITKPDG